MSRVNTVAVVLRAPLPKPTRSIYYRWLSGRPYHGFYLLLDLEPCHTICHFFVAFINSGISSTAAPPSPVPVRLPLLLTSSAAWRSQLLSRHRMPRRHEIAPPLQRPPSTHLPPFLAAVGHNAVSPPDNKGERSVDPSVARNTLKSSDRDWARLFLDRPGPAFSRPTTVPNITRRVSCSFFVRCTAPAKRRRRLRVIVSTLSDLLLVESLDERHEVVNALSALQANDL